MDRRLGPIRRLGRRRFAAPLEVGFGEEVAQQGAHLARSARRGESLELGKRRLDRLLWVGGKLAAIDLGKRTVPTDTVDPYRRLLDRMEPRCSESRVRIADLIATGRSNLDEGYGKKATNLWLMRQAVEVIEASSLTRQNCVETVNQLVVTLGTS